MKSKLHWMELLIILLSITIIIFSFLSCMNAKKAVSYLKKKKLLADTCAANYPVRDSIIVRDSIRIDTVITQAGDPRIDTFIQNNTVYITRTVPVNQYVIKTITRDSIVIRRDSAGEEAHRQTISKLTADLSVTTKDRESWKNKAKIRWWIIVALIATNLLSIAWKFKLPSLLKFNE